MRSARLFKFLGGIAAVGILAFPAVASPTTVSAQQTVRVSSVVQPDGTYRFAPAAINVAVGTTVVWPVDTTDPMNHTVNSQGEGPLNSGNLTPGQSYSFTFTQPGTYNYICRYHGLRGQTGSVVVTAGGGATAPAAPAAPAAPSAPAAPAPGAALPPAPGGTTPPAQTASTWPPVISEMAQLTVGNLSGLIIVVSNRTSNQHAFVDVRGYVPGTASVIDSFANAPSSNRGKLEGLAPNGFQVGWINHFVRAGQSQGPFVIIVDNKGQTLQSWSWLWFSTGGEQGSARNRYNGNYTSPTISTDAGISLPAGIGAPAAR